MERRVRTPDWETEGAPDGYYFDEEAADRAQWFFEGNADHNWPGLQHTKGRWAGKPFILANFQRPIIREIFGRMAPDGHRAVRTAYIEIPKKQGKSETAAGVALKLVSADDEYGAEVYGAAADRDQASIVYRVAASMARRNSELLALCHGGKTILDSGKRIAIPETESFYHAVSAEVATKSGYNSHGVIFDEVHCQKDLRLWDILTVGAGAAREQPLTFAITTAGIPDESPVAEMLYADADQILRGIIPCPPEFYPVIYAAPSNVAWDDEEIWRMANPALGDFLDLRSFREECEKAKRHASQQNPFRRLRLNQWLSQEIRPIDMAEWDACSGPVDFRELRHLTWFGGLDLSSRLDVTAFVLTALDGNGTYHIISWFWVPKDNLKDRANIEYTKYRIWCDQAYLTATPGDEVDFDTVMARIMEIGQEVNLRQIAYDPMFATHLAQKLGAQGFDMVKIPQGYAQYTEPWREFESALKARRIRHGGHPVLRWMADCLSIRQRADGAVRPVKPDRLKARKRIDGMVALLMALGRAMLNPSQPSVYDERGVIWI